MEIIALQDRSGLPETERLALAREVQALPTLAEVVPWALGRGLAVADVIVQDEYSHDFIVSGLGERALVFETT